MKNSVILFCLLAIVFSSCEDAFSTILEVDPPAHEPKLVANLFLNEEQTIFEARIGQTIPILEKLDLENDKINDAVAGLYKNGVLVKTLINHTDRGLNNYTLELDESITHGSGEYELRVEHPDFPNISSLQSMPKIPKSISITLTQDGGVDIDGDQLSRIELEFDDDPDVENYYEVSTIIVDSVRGGFYALGTNASVLNDFSTDEETSHLISDIGFNGKRNNLKFTIQQYYYNDLVEMGHVLLTSMTKDQYLYIKSARKIDQDGNFGGFAEPILIYSNIRNGQGCFGMSNSELIKF